MRTTTRAVRLLGLGVPPRSRARFLEEWQADLAASRELGLSEPQIVLAAARVTAFLLWVRLRAHVRQERASTQLVAIGVLLGAGMTVVDLPLDVFVPFVLPILAWWCARGIRRWIDGAP